MTEPLAPKMHDHEKEREARSEKLGPDQDETRLKMLLCAKIAASSENLGLRQSKIAALTGLAQSDVSRIVNGNVKDYSVWRLMRIINELGQNISIEFSQSSTDRGQIFTNLASEK